MPQVRIQGGLGNQLFQLCAALYLQKRLQKNIFLDVSSYHSDNLRDLAIKLLIPSEHTTQIVIKDRGIVFDTLYRIIRKVVHEFNWRNKHIDEFSNTFVKPKIEKGKFFYDGYFQCPDMVHEVREEIEQFLNHYSKSVGTIDFECRKQCASVKNVCAVHVRRGDYVKSKIYNVMDDYSYYKKAIDFMKNRYNIKRFIIFSDDIEWCKIFFKNVASDFYGPDEKSDLDALLLLAQYQHFIISNSSFSWWAVELSSMINNVKPNVCSPEKWSNHLSDHGQTLIQKDWHVIGV